MTVSKTPPTFPLIPFTEILKFICTIFSDVNSTRTGRPIRGNTSHIIKRTGKMVKIDRNIAFSGLKFDAQRAKI